jgi:ribose transport system permease protein
MPESSRPEKIEAKPPVGKESKLPPLPGSAGAGQFAARMFERRETGVLLALVALIVIMTLASPFFLRPLNIFNVLRGMSTIAIMSIGVTMVIIAGGIDLSVGSLLAVSGMFTARIMYSGINPWVSALLGFSLGLLLGVVNGFVITKVRVTAFITTLGMLSIGRGLTYLLATGLIGAVASNIPMRDPGVNFIGGGYIGPVPFPIIEMLALVAAFTWFLGRTVLGRQIYAVGSNDEAARLSGVNVNRVRLFTYAVTGALCGLAGIMSGGLLATAATNAGEGSELDVIAAVVIGGTSLSGGEGSIIGAIIGAAIMAVLRNAFVLLHLPAFLQTVSIGVVIILAVATDNLRKHPGRA